MWSSRTGRHKHGERRHLCRWQSTTRLYRKQAGLWHNADGKYHPRGRFLFRHSGLLGLEPYRRFRTTTYLSWVTCFTIPSLRPSTRRRYGVMTWCSRRPQPQAPLSTQPSSRDTPANHRTTEISTTSGAQERDAARADQGVLLINGSLVENIRGAVGEVIAGNQFGFARVINFDSRFATAPPPFNPTTGALQIVAYEDMGT